MQKLLKPPERAEETADEVVNSKYGGVQDEWLRMGKVAFLT